MTEYDRGDTARLRVLVTDPVTGLPVTPTSLTITTVTPGGVSTTSANFGAPIVTDAVGAYHALIPVTESGNYRYEWRVTNPDDVRGGTLVVYPGPLDTGRRSVGDYTPSSADVAALMFSRVTGEYNITADDFTATTRPTVGQVNGMITLAVGHVSGLVGFNLDSQFHSGARFVTTLYTTLLLEPGYWPEQQRPDKSAWEQWKILYDDSLKALLHAIAEEGAGGDVGPGDDQSMPVWAFPCAPARVQGIDY